MNCFEIGCALSRALKGGKRGALADFFLLDSQTLNKISIAAALCLPTSKAVGK
jgi:hypothetical protein